MRIHYLEFLTYRALAELRRDASTMYLGMLWWILEPILYMAVFYAVFGIGLKKGGLDYVLYLLCGLVPWKWLDSTVRTSGGIVGASAGLMRQLYFPKWILPGYIVIANMYKFFIIFFLLLLFICIAGIHPSTCWLALPLIILMQFMFICALSGLVSAIVPLIPDLKHAVHYGMTMLFFMSGIFFDISDLGEPVRSWLSWNPALIFIASYREILLNQLWPDWFLLMRVMFVTFIVLLTVSVLFRNLDRYYPRVVN